MARARSAWSVTCLAALAASVLAAGPEEQAAGRESYLTWSAKQAESVGRSTYQKGRVGGFWDTRMLKTERSYNYKLAATWLTPDVIKATARLAQLRRRLSDDETRSLVADALGAGDTVVMVEVDPREGSGVIPLDWESFVQPAGATERAVPGIGTPALRDVQALAGVLRRNYDYDRFWVVFPLLDESGVSLFGGGVSSVELVVRIYDKEGRVTRPGLPSCPHGLLALRLFVVPCVDPPAA